MFNQIFHQPVDNTRRGDKVALWFFAPLALMKVGISGGRNLAKWKFL
jgi:hypothetical protein